MDEANVSNSSINKHYKLPFLQFTILIFTLICSGPFGLETSIQSGGVLYTLIALKIVPIIYSIPQSLMCSELGSMMPGFHGSIIWVYRAFKNDGKIGNFLGFYNAISGIIALGKDIPLYIILTLFYIKKLLSNHFGLDITYFMEYLIGLFIIFIGALFNIANITILGNSSIIFTIIIFIPFFVGFIYCFPSTNVDAVINTKPQNDIGEYQWGLFISTIIWLHTGWDYIGSLSADIAFSKSKIIYALLIAMLLQYIAYSLPILGALTIDCTNTQTQHCWDNGYLYTAYNKIVPGLGPFIAISGVMANFSGYIAELSVQSRSFWALSQPFVIITNSRKMYIESNNGILYDDNMQIVVDDEINITDTRNIDKIRIGIFPYWPCGTIWNKTGSPIGGVILQSFICCILILFDFQFLVQSTVLINAITWCVELTSLLRLRYTEPNTYRPYKVPGGLFVVWLITIDKIIVVAILYFFVIRDHPQYILISITSFGFIFIWYLLYTRHYNQIDTVSYQSIGRSTD